MSDPDLLAIRRKRRQEKRCLACGTPTPRAALCAGCRETLRYCPACEAIYPLAESVSQRCERGRATGYCKPCGYLIRNGVRTPRQQWQAEARARAAKRLPPVLRLYRQGLSYPAMAAALGMTRPALAGLINYARKVGLWPAELRRSQR